MRITHILETHRNEDYVVGSVEMASLTGAEIWHADNQWNYRYGQAAMPGQIWKAGRLKIEAIPTPGHTPGSMSYLLHDPGGLPWVVFTGDALFAGDVGRIDLLGKDKAPEMAGLLYESIFSRLLTLGDQILVCPAHGAGSVCGESIAERVWTTIGIERQNKPRLKLTDKDGFVADILKSQPERPPYFAQMEKVNLEGATPQSLFSLQPLSPYDFASMAKDVFVLDTRMELCFGAAHVQGAQSIWIDGLASFAGWYIQELMRDGQISGALHIHVTAIPERLNEVPKDGDLFIFCGSGMRSMIAASFLERHGWENLAVVLGGMAGWRSIECPISKGS